MMKKGIVLFTTLMILMLLLSVMVYFLEFTKKAKDQVTYEFALLQTNSIVTNLVSYFKTIDLDQQSIFYGSGVPFTLELGTHTVTLEINSAHKLLDINTLAHAIETKDTPAYTEFVNFLYTKRLRDPELFIDILLDTVDNDKEEKNSGSGSEIVLLNPRFANGAIYNQKHFDTIIEYYATVSNDQDIYNIAFENYFSFRGGSLDINYLSKELLNLLFHDANSFSLSQIVDHNERYEELDELPFDEYYLKKINSGRMGHSIGVESALIKVDASFEYTEQFRSSIEFFYDVKNKVLSGYKVKDITFE